MQRPLPPGPSIASQPLMQQHSSPQPAPALIPNTLAQAWSSSLRHSRNSLPTQRKTGDSVHLSWWLLSKAVTKFHTLSCLVPDIWNCTWIWVKHFFPFAPRKWHFQINLTQPCPKPGMQGAQNTEPPGDADWSRKGKQGPNPNVCHRHLRTDLIRFGPLKSMEDNA